MRKFLEEAKGQSAAERGGLVWEETAMNRLLGVSVLVLIGLSIGCEEAKVEKAKVRGGGKEWAIKADMAGACNCAVPCPCGGLGPPTLGYCETNQLVEIKKGHYKGVSLDGLSLVMTWRGGNWVKYYVSDKATDKQFDAVQKLMPAAVGFISKMKVLSAEKVPVSVERTATRIKFSVPESKVEIERVKGRDGGPMITQNHPHPWKAIDLIQYKAIAWSHDGKDDKKFSYSGTNASTSKVDVASKD